MSDVWVFVSTCVLCFLFRPQSNTAWEEVFVEESVSTSSITSESYLQVLIVTSRYTFRVHSCYVTGWVTQNGFRTQTFRGWNDIKPVFSNNAIVPSRVNQFFIFYSYEHKHWVIQSRQWLQRGKKGLGMSCVIKRALGAKQTLSWTVATYELVATMNSSSVHTLLC